MQTVPGKKISKTDLDKLVLLAQKAAPSQCNRQSVRLHYYSDPNQIQSLLELQRGALSFSDEICNLFIVTSDQRSWFGSAQRNQSYVDGGIFREFFYFHLTACNHALNLAVTHDIENQIRSTGKIPYNERLVMMVAVGYGEDKFLAAVSPRRNVSSTLITH